MADIPVQIIVAAFQDPNGASEALKQLKQAQSEGTIKLEDAAVLQKDSSGKLHIKETADMGGGKGAVVGGVIGGVIGIIAGPPGVALGAAAGAAVGGLAAKMVDAGFPDERLREIGAGLQPNTSAIVAVVQHVWVAEAERQIQEAGAKAVTTALSADIAKQLSEGKDVAFSAVAAGDTVGLNRTAVGKDSAEVSDMVATPDGVYLDQVTRKGDDVQAAAAVVTDAGAVVVEGKGKLTDAGAPAQVQAPKADAAPAQVEAPKADAAPASTPPAAESKPPAASEPKADAPNKSA